MTLLALLMPLVLANPPTLKAPPPRAVKTASAPQAPAQAPAQPVALPTNMTLVEFIDRDASLSVTIGDGLRIGFATAPPAQVTLSQIKLANDNDSFGVGAAVTSEPRARQITITLGDKPKLKIGGVYPARDAKSGLTASAVKLGNNVMDIRDERVRLIEARYRDEYVKRRRVVSQKLSANDSKMFYDMAPFLDGLVTWYEATGDTQYIDSLIGHLDEMLAQGKDLTGDGYVDFYAQNLKRPNVQLYDWRGFKAMARLTRLIGTDAALRQRYGDAFERYYSFVEVQLIDKWSATYARSKRKYDHPFLPYERENLIHRASHMGNILIDYQLLAANDKGRAGVEAVAGRMKKQIQRATQVADTVEWNILYNNNGPILRDRSTLKGVSDVSHAAATVSMIVAEALGTRVVFNRQDLDALSNTLVKVVWNGDREDVKLSDFIDGGISSKTPYAYGDDSIGDGWAALGVYRRDVQDLLLLLENKGRMGLYSYQFAAHLARNFSHAHWY